MTHFKIIVPVYNCEKLIVNCLESIFQQSYADYQVIVCVEPCTDNTFEVLLEYKLLKNDARLIIVKNDIRKYVPKNHIDGIYKSMPNNEDVIICVDGDDILYGSEVLKYLNNIYQDSDIWTTWGSYTFSHDRLKRGDASQPVPLLKNDKHNGARWWRFSHLKTFRYFLFKGITNGDVRDSTGAYYTVAGDMALMFPMIELAGEKHRKYIDKILYVYNQSTIYNDEKIRLNEVKRCDLEIRNKKQKTPKTKEELISCLGPT